MKKRNRGNGEGSVFKRTDDGPYFISWYGADTANARRTAPRRPTRRRLSGSWPRSWLDVALRRDGVIDTRQESIIIEAGESPWTRTLPISKP